MTAVEQLPLAFRQTPVAGPEWSAQLVALLGRPVNVRFTDNSHTMISAKTREGILQLRLHHMFQAAPDEILLDLARFLQNRRGAGACLDAFIKRNRERITRRRKQRKGRSAGRRFDLGRIRDALCRAYLGQPLDVPVIWGRLPARRRRRSLRLGSYCFEDRQVRIHPVLDQDWVPACVVVGVVYHELLHHVLGEGAGPGRRRLHTRQFRERERLYVHFPRAEAWEKENLGRLVRSIAALRKA